MSKMCLQWIRTEDQKEGRVSKKKMLLVQKKKKTFESSLMRMIWEGFLNLCF